MTKKILFLDIGSDVRDNIRQVVAGLRDRGIAVDHPSNSKTLAPLVRLGSDHTSHNAVIHFDLGMPNQFTSLLEACENAGIRVMNPHAISMRLYNRVGLCSFLDELDIKQPAWYYGHPGSIPEDFGDRVVLKALDGHLVHLVERERIHSSDEFGFYQALVPNNSGITHTVYRVFGSFFTAVKSCVFTCPLNQRKAKMLLDDNEPKEIAVVEKIWRKTKLDFFCVEFVGDQVIDVNPYPNPFFHPKAVIWLVDGICAELDQLHH